MRLKAFATAALVLAGIGIGISLTASTPIDSEVSAGPSADVVASAITVAPSAIVTAALPAKTSMTVAVSEDQEISAKVWNDFKYQKELDNYSVIKKKALLLEQDKVTKAELLRNSDFLNSLQALLLTAAPNDEAAHMQNTAVDFMFEALKGELRSEVVQILQAVVADPTIEDQNRSLNFRKSLAGVKAEVLFHWSAMEPASSRKIAAALPGPVSQKIWANVKYQQENNLAESAQLARPAAFQQ